MKIHIVVAAAGALFMVMPALHAENTAQHHSLINRVQQRERHAIRRGVRNDELTRLEAHRLIHEQRRIQGMENRARSDGQFTPRERYRLLTELNQAKRHIYRNTHDRQER
jgi:hypothetical protein